MSGLLELLGRYRSMNRRQSLVTIQQMPGLTSLRRQWFRPETNRRQHRLHQVSEAIRRQSLREGVHRQKPADASGLQWSLGTFHDFDQRILKAQAVGTVFDQTAYSNSGSIGIKPCLTMEIGGIAEAPTCQETTHLDSTGGILKLKFDDGEIGISRAREAVTSTYGCDDRGCFARHQSFNPT